MTTTTEILMLIPVAIAAYLLGSVPFGIVITRVMGLGNLRDIGSGNIGTTNVLRTGSKTAAFLTLILDAGKGGVAVLIARALFGDMAAQIAALASFVGHCYPVWLKFQGGKGVATFLGILLALFWPAGIAACLTWLVTALATRISSLSALVASATASLWAWVLGMSSLVILLSVFALLIWWRHRENIQRLLAGKESKIGG
ncbi:glycerol-3-phosphate acyltransferase [Amylibacter marinus]|uniref:Glycerol-3-phosphate acyltransferase n=1 Tax=Amylibacter marinus TaxID=1475483 RepID=A0ABQ5VXI2_9RHOB|nr:glycerol-3-phosphate 1-O-acyltransferase PlsY [Amylibacter marinus]GLQ35912.1 glycerol-3-phosphate acyltransferase [Amylibacter marinus]